jgi:transcription-repair coupling factor (superfamily II helicase)
LDNSKSENDLKIFETQMKDRFGEIPEQTKQLINVVRLRWLAMKLGFEKLFLKKGKLTGYFISNQKSLFYQSETFSKILNFVQKNPRQFTMKQGEEKLSLAIERITNIKEAMEILKKILG